MGHGGRRRGAARGRRRGRPARPPPSGRHRSAGSRFTGDLHTAFGLALPAHAAAAVIPAAAVTHGGNNSVTEGAGAGVPLLVLPFSTDQFAGAAAIEREDIGRALDPNAASVDDLEAALSALLDPAWAGRATLTAIRADQLSDPGPERAYRTLTA